MAKRLQNLRRRNGIYHFRMRVPVGLQGRFSKREVYGSLRTSSPEIARVRGRLIATHIENLFNLVEIMPELEKHDIDQMLRGYFAEIYNESDKMIDKHRSQDNFNAYDFIESFENFYQEQKQNLKTGNLKAGDTEEQAKNLCARYKEEFPTDSDMGRYLLQGLLRAKMQNTLLVIKRYKGRYHQLQVSDPLFVGALENNTEKLIQQQSCYETHGLKALFAEYAEMKDYTGKWKLTSKARGKSYKALEIFLEMKEVDDLLVGKITKDDFYNFHKLLHKIPPNYKKYLNANGGTIKQFLLQSTAVTSTMNKQTASHYLNDFKAFIMWCVETEKRDSNPIPIKCTIEYKKNNKDARLPYSEKQLQDIFTSPQFVGHQSPKIRVKSGDIIIDDHKYWVPLIALYSGMRMGEILQLTIENIKQEENIWYFDINDDDGKQVKTEASIRRVPIHSTLLKLGLLAYSTFKKHFLMLR